MWHYYKNGDIVLLSKPSLIFQVHCGCVCLHIFSIFYNALVWTVLYLERRMVRLVVIQLTLFGMHKNE